MAPETLPSARPATAPPVPVSRPRRVVQAAERLLPVDAAGFAVLSGVLVAAMYLNIVSGAFVRLTASGLGCPDWPLCHGEPVPPASYHALIEFSNRVVALAGIGTALVTWFAARRLAGSTSRRLALAAAGLTLFQIPLGGITVYFHLHPLLVMSHFLVAIGALAAASVLWARSFGSREPAAAQPPLLRATAVGVAVLCLALIVSGAFSTAAGPHSGGIDIRRMGDWWQVTHIHVIVASAYIACVTGLLVALRVRRVRSAGVVPLAAALVVLIPLQAFLGEWQRMHGLPWPVVLAHVAVAGALWIATVALATRVAAQG